MFKMRYQTGWVVGAWLFSLFIAVLIAFTPLEFLPLPLGNVPRWLTWGLAIPACRLLQARVPRLRWVLTALPWLLWGPLVLGQGLWFLLSLGASGPMVWSRVLEPVRTLFACDDEWHTKRVLFRRGRQFVVTQRLSDESFGPRYARTALVTPLLPGIQWAQRMDRDSVLDNSWLFVDTLRKDENSLYAVRLSRDSAVHRWIRPWLQARHRMGQLHQRTLFRQHLGPQHPDTLEQLPASTQHGANTLGCVLSSSGPATQAGLRLRPTVRQGRACRAIFQPGSADSDAPRNMLSVQAEFLVHGIPHNFSFRITGVNGPGTYRLAGCESPNSWSTMQLFDPWHYEQYCSRGPASAVVTITDWSTKQHTVSGIFEGMMQAGPQSREIAAVCEGRFDLQYLQQ